MSLSCIFIVYNAFAEFIAPKQKRLKHNNRHFAHPAHTHLHPLLQLHLRTHTRNLQYTPTHSGRRLKIERTLTLEPNLSCVLSINKDYILYIFVQKNDLSLAFDAVKKITEFFNSNIKMFAGANGQARL